jgi:hypothetical protein
LLVNFFCILETWPSSFPCPETLHSPKGLFCVRTLKCFYRPIICKKNIFFSSLCKVLGKFSHHLKKKKKKKEGRSVRRVCTVTLTPARQLAVPRGRGDPAGRARPETSQLRRPRPAGKLGVASGSHSQPAAPGLRNRPPGRRPAPRRPSHSSRPRPAILTASAARRPSPPSCTTTSFLFALPASPRAATSATEPPVTQTLQPQRPGLVPPPYLWNL